MVLAETVKFRRELGSSLGQCTEGIEWNREMAITANCVNKLSRSSDIAKKSGIKLSRSRSFARSTCCRCCSTQILGESEKLTPRLIDRCWIAPIGFVGLAYVPVVEDARDRVGAHTSKFNCALLSLVRWQEGGWSTSDARQRRAES